MKINPAAVAYDVDGVIADTMTLFLDIARDEYGINGISYEDMTCYILEDCLDIDPAVINDILDRILKGAYSTTLKPMDGAAEALTRLAEVCRPLLFVTARSDAKVIDEWFQSILPLNPGDFNVIATGTFDAKSAVLRQHGIRYFVEDRLETCFQVKSFGIEPVVYCQPWNREQHPFLEVQNWSELEALMSG